MDKQSVQEPEPLIRQCWILLFIIGFGTIACLVYAVPSNTKLSPTPGTADSITHVCEATQDPAFCKKTFASDPRSKTANLPILQTIAMELGTKSASQTLDKIRNLHTHATDPRYKKIYRECDDDYTDILVAFGQAKDYAKAGDQFNVNIQAAGVVQNAFVCDRLFKKATPVLSPLSQDAQRFGEIVSIISLRI